MSFWSAATHQAGREFGARYWRWFAAGKVLGRVLPGLMWTVAIAGTIGALVLGYLWLAPDWTAIGSTMVDGAAGVGRWILVSVIIASIAGGIGWGLTALWRAHSWRWSRF